MPQQIDGKINLADYLCEVSESLYGCEPFIRQAVDMIKGLKKTGHRLWVLGNGGSLAIGQHFAQDLIKMRGVKAHAMTCPSMITAYTNDESFEDSFYSPLSVLKSTGDLVIIFSCSGNSRNYEKIVTGVLPVISVVGCDGGFLKEKSDLCVHVKNKNYQICETAFCAVADLINLGLGE